jgi:predicted ATPase/class 3 adenylate cyclase
MPELPRGTVTFLFTDIEGSTALWERDRAAMREAVARQLAILQSLIAAHHGVLYKTIGDGTQAAFASADDAVRAAVAAQRALLQETWAEPLGPLRVRMAIHTAAAVPQDGDYLAAGLNRLARLMTAGHGGQVLLSLATQDLARDALPPGVTLRDLGEHPLRDLYRPERVFQLLHPDLPADFSPIRTLASRPNNLPVQPTPFLGREDQVARVVDLLNRDDVRLLTITGPGGVGKTRLALQAAADLLDGFPDGVWFVDLSPLDDPNLVPAAVAGVLGVRDEGSALTDRLASVLGEKRLLLVLDNCERVVEAVAFVADLLARATDVKVLATSRTPLDAYGEQEYPLGPLPLPDPAHLPTLDQLSQYEAVRLFIERALAVKPDFAITNANAPAVAEICSRLDGLPLAIELAAAHVKVLPPQALLKRLERRLPLLTGGERTRPARQQTMRDAISWSYDLLRLEEQALFRRLAVFPGGCTLEAAEAVGTLEGPLDVYAGITSLVDRSLLRQEEGLDGEPRFRMLETIREYAGERLAASAEEEPTWQSHLAYLLTLARANDLDNRPVSSEEFEARLARLTPEEANLRVTLKWAQIHDPETALALCALAGSLWSELGRMRVGLELHERTLTMADDADSRDRLWVLTGAAYYAMELGEFAHAEERAASAFALAERLGEARSAAFARFVQGSAARDQVGGARGEALLRDALVRFEALGEDWSVAGCLNGLAIHALYEGDAGAAIDLFERSLAFAVAQDDPRMAALTRVNLSWAHYSLGHHEQAFELATHAAFQAERFGETKMRAGSRNVLGLLALKRGELGHAATLIAESLRLRWDFGDKWNVAQVLEGAAEVMVASDRAEAAARVYGAVEALHEAINSPRMVLAEDDYEQAVIAIRAALDEATFAQVWAQGRRLPLAEAVRDTLETLAAISGDQPTTTASAASAVDRSTIA